MGLPAPCRSETRIAQSLYRLRGLDEILHNDTDEWRHCIQMPFLQVQRQHSGFQQPEWQPPHPSGGSHEPARCGVACLLSAACQRPNETTMKQGDHVKVIGRDGVYVFLKEVQGTATLRAGGAKSPDK